jgi:hypothetical protein
MKKLFTLLTMLVIGIGSMWATVDTQIIKPSTSTSDPEHVYFMHCLNSDNDFATQNAYASNTAADAAKFAFFQATDANGDAIENAYYIYCVNNSKWMSYTKQDAYNNGKSFVTMSTTDKSSANYFYMGYVTMNASSVSGTKAYAIRPYNNNGLASRYLNWFEGVGNNRSTTIGLYNHGVDDAGSGWAFIEAPRIGRYYRIKSYASSKYLATNSATDATDNTTLYCYTDKGLAQISSGKYYNGSEKTVGTTQYPVTIQPNVNGASGALQFMTNGFWAYSKSTGALDRGSGVPDQTGYAWYFEEVDGPIAFVPTLNDIRDAKWYNLKVRGKYIKYNATPNSYDGNFYDTEESAPLSSDKSSWFTFVGDPFKGFKIICFADAAAFCSNDVNTDTRIYAGRPENANDYVFEILSLNNELAWQIRDKRGDHAFLNQQAGALGIWNHDARPDVGNRFVITEVEDAEAEYFVTYNIIATDENGENEISWSYDRLYGTGQTMGETPVDLPFVSNYSCDDPTLSGPVCSLTYTATHTMPFVSDKYYYMKQRKNNEGSNPKNGYAYYDSARTTNGMPKTKTIGATENYLWKFVGNPYDGYKIYNKANGDAQGLYMTRTGSSLTWNGTPSAFTLHTMSISDPNQVVPDGAASTYFKLKGSANNCLHDLGGVLNNWNDGGAVTDAGTIIGFYEAEEYNIVVSGADNGSIIINGTEYANGSKYFNMKGESFTSSAKIISYYHAGDISISENTISLDYTEITVPDGYNGFIAGKTNINADDWKTKSNWLLVNEEKVWTIGPGYTDSNMWEPIYLQDVTATGIAFEGWNLRLKLVNSSLTATTQKFQHGDAAAVTIDVDENSTLDITMAGADNQNDPGTHTFNIDGKLTIKTKANHWKTNSTNNINLGVTGQFTFTADNNQTIPSNVDFNISATLTDPTEDNRVQSRTLATFTYVTVSTLSTSISGTGDWTSVDSKSALGEQTEDGKYYYVEKNNSSGVTLYTYKLNAPVKENDGAITVDADITSGIVELINTAISENKATSVNLTETTTKEITGLEIPANCLNCLVIVNNGTTVKDGSNKNIENNVVVKVGENYSCEKLVLTDKVPFKAPVEFTATSITHERKTSSTSAVWGTACLPYPVRSVSGDDGIRYYQLSESNSKEGVMSFTLITDVIAANTPVVFIKSSGAEFNFNSTDKRVAITPANLESSEIQGKTLVGTFAGSNDVATDDSKNYYYISGNKFWHATGTLKVSPFRAYFTETKGGQTVRNYTLQVVDDGNVTRIDSVEGFDMSDEQVYTLDGKKVNNVKKGSIYIIGGNKVVIK